MGQKFKDMFKFKIPRYSVLCAMKRSGIKDAEKRIREIEPVNITTWLKMLASGISEEEVRKEMIHWDYDPEETFKQISSERRKYLKKHVNRLKVGVPIGAVLRDVKKEKSFLLEDISYLEEKLKEYEAAKLFEKKKDKYVK